MVRNFLRGLVCVLALTVLHAVVGADTVLHVPAADVWHINGCTDAVITPEAFGYDFNGSCAGIDYGWLGGSLPSVVWYAPDTAADAGSIAVFAPYGDLTPGVGTYTMERNPDGSRDFTFRTAPPVRMPDSRKLETAVTYR